MDPGELFLETLREVLREEGMHSAAVTSAIGTFDLFRYRRIIGNGTEALEAEGPLELIAVQGIAAEGEPHLHAVVSDNLDNVFCGHVLEGCRVLYVLEMLVQEIKEPRLVRPGGRLTAEEAAQ
jgi:predicted DNA-binding protein with PD1-like motif